MSKSTNLGETQEIRVASGTVRYREIGAGPPIVFLHGIVANGDVWRNVVPELAATHRCITPDWPLGAHREPMRPDADLSVPGLAALVDDVLDALALDDVTLVANDTGGAIAQWVAAHHAARVGRLVLTPCDAFENFPPLLLRHLRVFGRTSPGLWVLGQALRLRAVQRLPIAFGRLTVRPIEPAAMRSFTRPLATDAGVRRDFARLVRAISPTYTRQVAEELHRFDKPALIVWGLDDRLFPLAHAHRLAGLLPDCELEVVEDAGAFLAEDQPERLAAAIARFLDGPAVPRMQT